MTRWIAMGVVIVAAGCTVGPDYQQPELSRPAAWSSNGGGAVAVRWWQLFKDPTLDSLITRAVAANPDRKIALARVREARALALAAGSMKWPAVDAGASITRTRQTQNGLAPDFGQDFEVTLHRAGFDASWEIDVFGGRRRAIEAADADVEVAEADLHGAMVSLVGEVARNYIEVRGTQRQLAVLREIAAAARDALDLTRKRLEAGLGTALDVARAEAMAAQTQAEIPPVETDRQRAVHRLGALLGREPNALASELEAAAPVPAIPERVHTGLPSDLLLRRPDVRRAERNLAAATARVGVATSHLYPSFSIAATLGLESASGGDLLQAASRFWSIGPAVRIPIFQGNRSKAVVLAADARTEQAIAMYEKAFLMALEEVENALVTFGQEGERRKALADAVAANRRSVDLSRRMFDEGQTGFLDVLEAERQLYATQGRLARSETDVAAGIVALYKALGGGWEEEPDAK